MNFSSKYRFQACLSVARKIGDYHIPDLDLGTSKILVMTNTVFWITPLFCKDAHTGSVIGLHCFIELSHKLQSLVHSGVGGSSFDKKFGP